jgi:hypothetical protein
MYSVKKKLDKTNIGEIHVVTPRNKEALC